MQNSSAQQADTLPPAAYTAPTVVHPMTNELLSQLREASQGAPSFTILDPGASSSAVPSATRPVVEGALPEIRRRRLDAAALTIATGWLTAALTALASWLARVRRGA